MLANTIQSIINTDEALLQTGALLKEAISLMNEKNNSCIIIDEKRFPVGIITERDLIRIAAGNLNTGRIRVEEVMTSPVKTVTKDMDIYEAALYLNENNIRRIVIVNESGEFMGLINQTDLKDHLGSVYYVKLKTIRNIMTSQVITAEYDEKMSVSLNKMSEHRLSCIVVCKGAVPVGMLTERDVSQLIEKNESYFDLNTKEVMISPLCTISHQTSIFEAAKLMKTRKIRRLVVIDEKGLLAGLVTESDIVKHFDACCLESLRNIMVKDRDFINTLKDGVLEVYPQINGEITWINHAGAKLLGYESIEGVVGKRLEDLFQEKKDLETLLERLKADGEARDFRAFFNRPHHDPFYMEGMFDSFTDEFDCTTSIRATFRDITQRKRSEEMVDKKVKEQTREISEKNKQLKKANKKLKELSIRDGLTNLMNLRYFCEILNMEVAKSKRYNLPLSCIIIDIDDFKFINDNFGHAIGDFALIKTAELLKKNVRETDVVARYGGDEFTIVLPNTDFNVALLVANRILEAFRNYDLKNDSCSFGKISVSIGVSALPNDLISTDKQLMEYADKSMYRAKEHGKNNVASLV
ncbi:MAG: diguanylate cyclase [bacterium]